MPQVIPIDDPLDPRIAAFVQVRERDVVGRLGGFIAEGEVVLRVLARSPRFRAQALLIADNRIARLAPLVACFDDRVLVYSAAQTVMDQIVGFSIHRGVLAFGARGVAPSAQALLKSLAGPALVLGLFGISNHDNLGGVLRNAAALGAQGVLLDGACCDPLYRKAIRVSVGASLTVPFARFEPGEDAIDLLTRQGFDVLALTPAGSTPLARVERSPRMAVLLGAEGTGLPHGILERARTVAIPMHAGFDSLNVATASGIVLHHLAR